jgi:RNA polymerase sigma-70 factor (ECF subfamily)
MMESMGGQPYRPGSDLDFDRLYRETYPRLLATLVAVLNDRTAAEDCVQEAFLRAYRNWSRWKPDAPAEAWLHRIALNVAINARKREQLRTVGQLMLRLGRPTPEPDPAERVAGGVLLEALRKIPPRQAAALVLRFHHGYSNREIAVALGVPERTVASRLAAARRRVRDHLSPAWREGMGTFDPRGVSSSDG